MYSFKIEVSEDMINYLQRLGNEVESKVFLIDRIFANHATDTDTSMFDSVPFKHFLSEYEQAQASFELAKAEFQKSVLEPIVKEKTGEENPSFNWKIEDYLSKICEVTVLD